MRGEADKKRAVRCSIKEERQIARISDTGENTDLRINGIFGALGIFQGELLKMVRHKLCKIVILDLLPCGRRDEEVLDLHGNIHAHLLLPHFGTFYRIGNRAQGVGMQSIR